MHICIYACIYLSISIRIYIDIFSCLRFLSLSLSFAVSRCLFLFSRYRMETNACADRRTVQWCHFLMVMVPGSLFFKMFNKRVEALPKTRRACGSFHSISATKCQSHHVVLLVMEFGTSCCRTGDQKWCTWWIHIRHIRHIAQTWAVSLPSLAIELGGNSRSQF